MATTKWVRVARAMVRQQGWQAMKGARVARAIALTTGVACNKEGDGDGGESGGTRVLGKQRQRG